jgi:hypothetical protein
MRWPGRARRSTGRFGSIAGTDPVAERRLVGRGQQVTRTARRRDDCRSRAYDPVLASLALVGRVDQLCDRQTPRSERTVTRRLRLFTSERDPSASTINRSAIGPSKRTGQGLPYETTTAPVAKRSVNLGTCA